jgi:hypothetical protein
VQADRLDHGGAEILGEANRADRLVPRIDPALGDIAPWEWASVAACSACASWLTRSPP